MIYSIKNRIGKECIGLLCVWLYVRGMQLFDANHYTVAALIVLQYFPNNNLVSILFRFDVESHHECLLFSCNQSTQINLIDFETQP